MSVIAEKARDLSLEEMTSVSGAGLIFGEASPAVIDAINDQLRADPERASQAAPSGTVLYFRRWAFNRLG